MMLMEVQMLSNFEKFQLRQRRRVECFAKLDRSPYWYEELTDTQKYELKQWRQAWKDVTETGVIPETPEWLDGKLEPKKERTI